MEQWKKIEGFDGYEVSNKGNVRTNNKITHTKRHGERHWKNRKLKQAVVKDRSHRVALWKDGKDYHFLVHRLVAYAFLGKPENEKMTVNHKDGNRENNNVENLEWVSLGDNIRHAFRNGLIKSEKCILILPNGEEINCYSLSEASRQIGRSNGYISGCLKRNIPIKNTKKEICKIILQSEIINR